MGLLWNMRELNSINKQFWNGTACHDLAYKSKTDYRTQTLAVVAGVADPGNS
jgi:hypothetical protein